MNDSVLSRFEVMVLDAETLSLEQLAIDCPHYGHRTGRCAPGITMRYSSAVVCVYSLHLDDLNGCLVASAGLAQILLVSSIMESNADVVADGKDRSHC